MAQQSPDENSARWAESLDRVRAFVAARVGGDRELAADITNDVLVRSIASGALAEVDNPTAWLYRSARNAVIDHYRTRRVLEPLETDAWPEPDRVDSAPNDATRELARCLQPLMADLPTTARDALTRVDLEGQTHQQAASELGLSVSGMKSRVQRARRQLRDVLEQCCEVGLDHTGAVAGYRPTGHASCGCGVTTPCA